MKVSPFGFFTAPYRFVSNFYAIFIFGYGAKIGDDAKCGDGEDVAGAKVKQPKGETFTIFHISQSILG